MCDFSFLKYSYGFIWFNIVWNSSDSLFTPEFFIHTLSTLNTLYLLHSAVKRKIMYCRYLVIVFKIL